MNRHPILAAVVIALCPAAFADTWYVDAENSFPIQSGRSWTTAFTAIQAGIDAASDGDDVIVAEGTYVENVNFNGKNIVLQSTDPANPDVVANTVIDGERYSSVVTFSGEEAEECVLSGFTITCADSYWDYRRGISGNGTLATIENNTISHNLAMSLHYFFGEETMDNYGGGVCDCDGIIQKNTITRNAAGHSGGGLAYCDGIIRNNTISDNTAYGGDWFYGIVDGGGGALYSCNGTVENNIISGNSVDGTFSYGGFGGGLFECDGTVQNNAICDNSAYYGGGLYSCDGTVLNNTVTNNTAHGYGGGLYLSYGLISNCIVWANAAPDGAQLDNCSMPRYSCIQDWTEGGTGNIADDPRFIDLSAGDYHLQPDSPCIDTGNIDDLYVAAAAGCVNDIDGECRLAGGSVDIGSDEHNSPADTDGDLLPDSDEIALGLSPYDADTDSDGLMDGLELLRRTDPSSYDTPAGMVVLAGISSIQAALSLAFPSETIIVYPGTYYENLRFPGKDVVLRSTAPTSPGIVGSTIIDAGRNGPAVMFHGTESSDCVLSGFTITNGTASEGGGIRGYGTLATIEHCTISGNYSEDNGGGLYDCRGTIRNNIISDNSARYNGGGLSRCDGAIENNTISGNTADYEFGDGGGLHNCSGTIRNNTISENVAGVDGDGGGLFRCDALILGNTITDNWAEYGGGLADCNGTIQNNTIAGNSAGRNGGGLSGCDDAILNNTITDNSAANGGGLSRCNGAILNNTIAGNFAVYDGGGLDACSGAILNNTIADNSARTGDGLHRCDGFIANCIIWGDSPDSGPLFSSNMPLHSCIQNWTDGGAGNISDDPRFVDAPGGNYHLSSDSPCIDAGSLGHAYLPESWVGDIDGECRLAGSSIDMGSDEQNSSVDNDSDLLPDIDETASGSDPYNPDTDGDGVPDGLEVFRGTDPTVYTTASGISVPADLPSIQTAIMVAFPGELITVSPGTYYENLRFMGKDVILRSTDALDPAVVDSTIIDGSEADSVVTFGGAESPDCVLSGFTITNGRGYYGGVNGNGTLATIENNTVSANSAFRIYSGWVYLGGRGAGLYDCDGTVRNNTVSANSCSGNNTAGGGLYGCDGIIEANTISGNSAFEGGGLYDCDGVIDDNTLSGNSGGNGGGLCECDGVIQSNTISDNSVRGRGGGLYNCQATVQQNIILGNSAENHGGGVDGCDGTIRNNTISDNSAGYAGGGLWGCHGVVENNTISGNSASDSGGGLWACNGTIRNNTIYGNHADSAGGGLAWCDEAVIKNCAIWQNAAPEGAQLYECVDPSYSCIQDWTGGGEGNISDDPLLVNPDNGDFHLDPDSPCIDGGGLVDGLTDDFEGDPRPIDAVGDPRGDGSDFDIGADEFSDDIDSDGDGIVDADEGPGDADGDGVANYLDADSDGDTVPDEMERADDSDGDGLANYLDTDSDGDGMPDEDEGADDLDGDGTPNFLDLDSDENGIADSDEGAGDPDRDGIPDYRDLDNDGDGISDNDEGTDDPDADGVPNYLDTDSDGDGIPDLEEGTGDPDNDGTPSYLDTDSDGDGALDVEEAAFGTDPYDAADSPFPFGDVNRSRRADAIDVQLVINAILALPVDYDCDINGDGAVNVADLQLAINAALWIES